ncbi:MAG: hypothetical protein RIM99_20195 [Cyclobacteriaceae bacterium]
MKTTAKLSLALALTIGVSGCNESQDLNGIDHLTLSDPTTFPSIIGSQFGELWEVLHAGSSTMSLSVVAQELTSSHDQWGMSDLGAIPREPLKNSETYVNEGVIADVWFGVYGVLAQTNEILRQIDSGNDVVIDFNEDGTEENINNILRGVGKLLQGMCLGHIALRYDQGFVTDENTNLSDIALVRYSEVMTAAIEKLDEAIVLLSTNSFDVPANWFSGLTWTNTELTQFANSYAARLLSGASRTAAENAAADWSRILNYTNAGLTVDYAPLSDQGIKWTSRILIQGQDGVWARVSQRVISEMAIPSDRCSTCPGAYPWPNGIESLPPLSPGHDNRIDTDMAYSDPPSFNADKGYHFFSSYRYSRYQNYTGMPVPIVEYALVERDTYMAEALIRTGGSKNQAAALINNTRVNRGGLPVLTGSESDQELLNALFYERRAEIGWTWAPVIYYDRRRNDDLEPGTFKHMPIPDKELNALGLEPYTFGGLGKEM